MAGVQHMEMLLHYQQLSRSLLPAARQSQQGTAYQRLQASAMS